MAISLKAARGEYISDVSLQGDGLIFQGSTNTYTITDYNSFSDYSVSSDGGTATINDSTVTLVLPNPFTPEQVNLTVTKDGKDSIFSIAVGSSTIQKPTLISPVNGSSGLSTSPTLEGSVFSSIPIGLDTHQSSQWQIALDNEFLNIAFDSGVTTTNKTQIQATGLNIGMIYYARVRYTGVSLGNSAWSDVVTFTTATIYIAQPTITVPDGPSDVGETPTFTTSPFQVVGGTDTHASSDWQVIKTSDSSVVYQSLGNTVNKVSLPLPPSILLESTEYKVRVRHNGASYGSSPWAESIFTTRAEFFTFGPGSAGLPFGGGYYAGANIVAGGVEYALVVAPKALGGETSGTLQWKTSTTQTVGTASINDGLANTAAMMAAGASAHPAGNFCNNLVIGGYDDWYLPAKDELEIIYRYLKPTVNSNNTNYGANTSSRPTAGNYTSGNPAQTSVALFRSGATEALVSDYCWSSTEDSSTFGWSQVFSNGGQFNFTKTTTFYVRGVRRVAI